MQSRPQDFSSFSENGPLASRRKARITLTFALVGDFAQDNQAHPSRSAANCRTWLGLLQENSLPRRAGHAAVCRRPGAWTDMILPGDRIRSGTSPAPRRGPGQSRSSSRLGGEPGRLEGSSGRCPFHTDTRGNDGDSRQSWPRRSRSQCADPTALSYRRLHSLRKAFHDSRLFPD